MKSIYLFSYSLLLGSGLIICPSLLFAQDYQPFSLGRTYIYDCFYRVNGQEIVPGKYILEVDSVYFNGSDSVFAFNRIGIGGFGIIHPNMDNIFGREMIQASGGNYYFTTFNGDSATIITQAPVNASWIFYEPENISATLIAEAEESFLGVTDSVKIIALSTGDTIRISKTYGMIQSYRLRPAWYEGFNLQDSLTLAGIEELQLGEKRPGIREIYDFSPGDRFLRESETFSADHSTYIWTLLLSRNESLDGDTTWYIWERERVKEGYLGDSANAPWAQEYVGKDTFTNQIVWKEVETDFNFRHNSFFDRNSFEVDDVFYSILAGPAGYSEYANRLVYYWEGGYGGDEYVMSQFEYWEIGIYGIGLGSINTAEVWVGGGYRNNLLCYEKVSDSSSNSPCITPQSLVSNEDFPIAERSFSLYPNPASGFVNLEFSSPNRLSVAGFRVLNITGQPVFYHKLTRNDGQWRWNIQGFPSGMYFYFLESATGEIIHKGKLQVLNE